MNRTSYKTKLKGNLDILSLDAISQKSEGEYRIKCGNSIIDTFIFPPEKPTKKFYIYLSAIGIYRGEQTAYHRISWAKYNQDLTIYIDDPTRSLAKFAPTFYLGYGNSLLIEDICQLIKRLQSIYSISNENIVFVGSSNAGFASLKLASRFPDCYCLTFCPQFSIKLYLKEKFSILVKSLNRKFDICEEENVNKLILSPNFHLLVYSNLACQSDREQISYLEKLLGTPLKYGTINRIGNLSIIPIDIQNHDPHLVQPDYFESKLLLNVIDEKNISRAAKLTELVIRSLYFRHNKKVCINEKYILSYGNNLNPIRFLIKNLNKFDFEGFYQDNIIHKREFDIDFLSQEQVTAKLKEQNIQLISFKDGRELSRENTTLINHGLRPVIDYIPQFAFFENRIINFLKLIELFTVDDLETYFLYLRSHHKKICIIVGNCQTKAITELISVSEELTEDYAIIDIPRICDFPKYDINIDKLNLLIRNSDLIITQQIKTSNKFTPILSTEYLKSNIKKDCKFITISNLTFCGYYPQMKGNSTLANFSIGGSSLFPYTDSNIDLLLMDKIPRDEILLKILNPYFYTKKFIKSFIESELKVTEERDSLVDIKMSDVVRNEFNKNICFHSFNHPKIHLLQILANRILDKLGYPIVSKFPNIQFSMESQSQVVYPSVLAALDIPINLHDKIYFNEMAFNERVSLLEYLDIYINSKVLVSKK